MRRVTVLKAIRFRETDTSVGAAIYEAWYALNKRDSVAKESRFKIYPFHQSCKGVHKMRDVFVLKNEDFCLSLDFQVFQADISSPSNTILSVYIASNGFSAATTMDIDIKQLPVFCNDLKAIYNTLQGEAKIQDALRQSAIYFFCWRAIWAYCRIGRLTFEWIERVLAGTEV